MTVDCWRVRGPSRHRHGYRHRGKGLGKRFSRYRDGHDANDDELQVRSRQGARLYFVDSWSDKAPSAIRSIRRSVARASPIAVWSAPTNFWFL
jgi:hypothetical protein